MGAYTLIYGVNPVETKPFLVQLKKGVNGILTPHFESTDEAERYYLASAPKLDKK